MIKAGGSNCKNSFISTSIWNLLSINHIRNKIRILTNFKWKLKYWASCFQIVHMCCCKELLLLFILSPEQQHDGNCHNCTAEDDDGCCHSGDDDSEGFGSGFCNVRHFSNILIQIGPNYHLEVNTRIFFWCVCVCVCGGERGVSHTYPKHGAHKTTRIRVKEVRKKLLGKAP